MREGLDLNRHKMKAKTRNLGGWWTFLEGSKYLAGAEMVVHFLFKIIILLVMDQHWNWTLFYIDGEKMVKLMVVNSSGNDPLNMTWQSFLLKMVQQARRGSTLKVIVTTSLPDNDVTATVWDEHSNSNFLGGGFRFDTVFENYSKSLIFKFIFK